MGILYFAGPFLGDLPDGSVVRVIGSVKIPVVKPLNLIREEKWLTQWLCPCVKARAQAPLFVDAPVASVGLARAFFGDAKTCNGLLAAGPTHGLPPRP